MDVTDGFLLVLSLYLGAVSFQFLVDAVEDFDTEWNLKARMHMLARIVGGVLLMVAALYVFPETPI